MPIEVKELVIRAVVAKERKGGKPAPKPSAGSNHDVQKTAEQVIKIMQRKRRR